MDQNSREAFVILRENLQKLRYFRFVPDDEFVLDAGCRDLIEAVTREYHFEKAYPNNIRFEKWRRFWFERRMKKYPDRFPGLIYFESMKTATLSAAVPGGPFDQNLLLGLFREIPKPAGGYFTDPAGLPIKPLLPDLDALRLSLSAVVALLEKPGEVASDPVVLTKGILADLERFASVLQFIPELYQYSQNQGLPQLKSGHLLSYFSGMRLYFEALEPEMTRLGLAVVQLEGVEPPIPKVRTLSARLASAVRWITLDIMKPAIEAARLKVSSVRDSFMVSKVPPEVKRGWFSLLVSKILSMPEIATRQAQTAEPAIPQMATPERKKEAPKTDRLLDSKPFLDLVKNLEKFTGRLKEDLAPLVNEKGHVIHARQGFDEFDIPERERTPGIGHAQLYGKADSGDSASYKNSDVLVVKSTYWLYDRVKSMLSAYRISPHGISLEAARHFTADVESLFRASKAEYNEIRSFGTFQQFQVNLRRIFSSPGTQNRYFNHIRYLSEQFDEVTRLVKKEDEKETEKAAVEPGLTTVPTAEEA